MTTITTEKIEELRGKASKTTTGFMMMIWPEELIALLDLAERALEPQGQHQRWKLTDEDGSASYTDRWDVAKHHPNAQPQDGYTYASTQATKCAECGERKHTPLRIDAMGGYVCLTCIDRKLGSLLGEFGYEQPQGQALLELPDDTFLGGDPDYGDDVYGFTANQMGSYGRQCYDAGRASQLALPAAQQLIGAGHFTMNKSGRWEEVDRNAPNSTILYHGPEWPQKNTDPFSHEERTAADVKYQMMKTSYEAEIKQLREQLALPAGPVPTDEQIHSALRKTVTLPQAVDAIRNLLSSPAVAQPVPAEPVPEGSAAIEAIQFALKAEDGIAWLRLWNEGEFDICRQEWPEAPADVYIGADPLLPKTEIPSEVKQQDPNKIGAIRYLEWVLEDGTANERIVAMTALKILAGESPAVAQPVADEREAYEQWVAGKYEDEFDWFDIWQAGASHARAALCPPAEEGGKS